MTIQQLQIRYQQALENRRTTREALRLATELNNEAEQACAIAHATLQNAFKEALVGDEVGP